MCGIVGIRRFDGQPVDADLLRFMSAQLEHRGPDGEGHWLGPGVGLGHRRLSIIDPAGSPQPMPSHDGRLHVTFNGEILNYTALRRRLSYPFSTDGDTEVLLAMFDAQGRRAVDDLDGQFAFALFDEADQALWLFRDRLGILPLYYYADERMFAFASEIKALIPALPRAPEVDESSLHDYLGRRSVPAPFTLFKGIRKVPPGHRVHVERHGRITVEPYWTIPADDTTRDIRPQEAVGIFREALDAAVRRNLVADVPVGAYLSGGVDSSLIVATAVGLGLRSSFMTFSAGFGDPRYDEVHYAREVSRFLGTAHHEVTVTPGAFQTLWRRLTWHRDAPLSEPADVAVFKLATEARRHVKVVLSGEGSDELFGGYPKHRFARWTVAAGLAPTSARKALLRPIERALPARAGRLRIAMRALSAESEADRFMAWFAPFTASERTALLGRPACRGHGLRHPHGDALRRALFVDSHSWLADNLLERGDRMSMAASVELRPPFLDHHLVELAFSLPSSVKVRRGRTKWIVKEVARGVLPAAIVDRPKVGFRVPLDTWFRGGLEDLAWGSLLGANSFVATVMDRRAIQSLLESHRSGRRNEEIRIWTLLSLEMWHDTFFRGGTRRMAGREAVAVGDS
jgi:asparagine synthase (glutamine-hydrolysing)